jgi:hypothetical protein
MLESIVMKDIGVVTYCFDLTQNRMKANWTYSSLKGMESGTGLTDICDVKNGFEGNYKITYYDQNDEKHGTFDLEIKKKNECFDLTWRRENKKIFVGVGIENNGCLIAGWRKK